MYPARAAADYGVALENVYDQAVRVPRLRRSPRWRMELLGVSGDPPEREQSSSFTMPQAL